MTRAVPPRTGSVTASAMGIWKQSDFPEAVPVATATWRPARARSMASAWWDHSPSGGSRPGEPVGEGLGQRGQAGRARGQVLHVHQPGGAAVEHPEEGVGVGRGEEGHGIGRGSRWSGRPPTRAPW